MRFFGRPWLFDLGADIYALFTANKTWHESCKGLASYFPEPNGRGQLRVLDLGCGPGVTAINLAQVRPDAHLIGVDLAPRMVRFAHRQTARADLSQSISYVIADATALPFASNAIDVTTGHSFLYLVSNRAGVLEESYRVLRRGGRFASMEPRSGRTPPGMMRRHWRETRYLISVVAWRLYSLYHGRFDERNFTAALERAGFQKTGADPVLEGLGIIGHGEK